MLVSGGTLPAKVLRDNVLHLLRCWEVGQGPCLMSVLFARADPGYSFLSPLCLCQPQQKVSVWFVHWLHWGWSNLLWASSQQYPFPGEHWGAFLLLLERACRAHDLLSWLWRVPLILSTHQGFPWESLDSFHTIFTATGKANLSALQQSSRKAKLLDFFFLDAKFVQFIRGFNFAGENSQKGQQGAQVHSTQQDQLFACKKLWPATSLYSVQKVIVERNKTTAVVRTQLCVYVVPEGCWGRIYNWNIWLEA